MAERLGMTVAELGRRMSAAEMQEWVTRDEIHTDDAWYRHAQACLIAAQAAGSKKAKLEDFLPVRRKPPPDPREMAAKLRAFAESANARFHARNRGVAFT